MDSGSSQERHLVSVGSECTTVMTSCRLENLIHSQNESCCQSDFNRQSVRNDFVLEWIFQSAE